MADDLTSLVGADLERLGLAGTTTAANVLLLARRVQDGDGPLGQQVAAHRALHELLQQLGADAPEDDPVGDIADRRHGRPS